MSAATEAESRIHEVDETQVDRNELATPLDLLLADATSSPLRRFVPGMSGVRFTANLARHPVRVAGRTLELAAELAKVGVGRSELEAHEKDRRFADEGWAKNPLLKRTLQGYLALGEAARGLVEDADLGWGDGQRMGFIVDNLVEASVAEQQPVPQPQGAQAGHRHRWRQSGGGWTALRPRLRQCAPGPLDGGARRLRGRDRHRGDPG